MSHACKFACYAGGAASVGVGYLAGYFLRRHGGRLQ
jgi:hypothetical protein